MLRLDGVSKTYRAAGREVAAMRSVSLAVAPGEFVVVTGPSGCGKSTLLLACGGLLSPDSGAVTLCGADPYSMPPNRRAAFRADNIGFVFQQFHLIPYLTASDNVLLGAVRLDRAEARRRAAALLERFGLVSRAGHLPPELSVGERQRAGLARALVNRPALLLADEPTGNLDESSGRLVIESLAAHARDGGAVLMVTHDARAATMAGRVLRMSDGALEEK
jgi:putative ABC transport system ATP-binding protein